jgi:hypothetical protein
MATILDEIKIKPLFDTFSSQQRYAGRIAFENFEQSEPTEISFTKRKFLQT